MTAAQKHPQKYWLVVCGDAWTLTEQLTSEQQGPASQVPVIEVNVAGRRQWKCIFPDGNGSDKPSLSVSENRSELAKGQGLSLHPGGDACALSLLAPCGSGGGTSAVNLSPHCLPVPVK